MSTLTAPRLTAVPPTRGMSQSQLMGALLSARDLIVQGATSLAKLTRLSWIISLAKRSLGWIAGHINIAVRLGNISTMVALAPLVMPFARHILGRLKLRLSQAVGRVRGWISKVSRKSPANVREQTTPASAPTTASNEAAPSAASASMSPEQRVFDQIAKSEQRYPARKQSHNHRR